MRSLPSPTAAHYGIPPVGTDWTSRKQVVQTFKADFREWALNNQKERCVFCCFPVGDVTYRRSSEIDHIAPKGRKGYPKWAFEVLNLVIACGSCNSRLKGATDTVSSVAAGYVLCQFSIVHPYLDDVEAHVTGTYIGDGRRSGVPEAVTPKGERTVELFRLADPGYLKTANQEARQVRLDARQNALPARLVARLRAALTQASGR